MKKTGLFVLIMQALLNLQAQNCPASIAVSAPSAGVIAGKTFQFSVQVNGLLQNISVTYNWSVSAGSIVSGQGTAIITVEGNEPGYCTATVEIGGLPPQCSRTASASAEIRMGPEKIISTNTVTTTALQDAVKTFISKTDFKNITISQSALINIYAANAQQFLKLKAIVEKAFEINGIYPFQFTIADSGVNKAAAVDMFLIKNDY